MRNMLQLMTFPPELHKNTKRSCFSVHFNTKRTLSGHFVRKHPIIIRANIRMGRKCDPGDFDHGMVVGGLSISQTADLLGFSCTTVSSVQREGCEKEHPVSGSSVGENTLIMREVRGERPDRFKLTGKQQ